MKARAFETKDVPDSHTIQVDWNRHITMDLPARFVNHRCHTANLGAKENALGAFDFVALRRIREGEGLSWDYEDAEYDMDTTFECQCGDDNCRGLVRGWKYSLESLDDLAGIEKEFLPRYRLDYMKEKRK